MGMYKGLIMLKKLLNSEKSINLMVKSNSGKDLELNFCMNNQASEENFKNIIDLKLPKAYIEFLQEYNGGTLFNLQGIDGFKFLGTDNITKVNDKIQDEYQEDWLDEIVIFAECLGEGNYLGFKHLPNNDYEIIDCFHEEIPINWQPIGYKFEDFLEKLISVNGAKFYL